MGTASRSGTARCSRESGVDDRRRSTRRAAELAARGRTAVFVAVDGAPAGLLGVADPIRAHLAATRSRGSARMGLEVVMLTGDARATAEAVAREAGIDRVVAGVLPEGKLAEIERLQAEGQGRRDGGRRHQRRAGARAGGRRHRDGQRDRRRGGGRRRDAHAAATCARVADAIALSRRTMRTMRQNLFWAFAYNVVGIPVAAGALYPAFGLLLSPVLASAAMAVSSVSVVTNSLGLRRFRGA